MNPTTSADEKTKYINRLKDFVSPRVVGETRGKLIEAYMEDVKDRIELTVGSTQGGSHNVRPSKEQAENVVLYTYLIVSDLMEIYESKQLEPKVSETDVRQKAKEASNEPISGKPTKATG